MMSAPFAGPPALPSGTADQPPPSGASVHKVHDELAALPRPRKHYHGYYSTREANDDMRYCPQGVHAFLRAYYHFKSGDYEGNRPFPLRAWSAEELARLPTYYVMDLNKGMAETVAPVMPSAAAIAACEWLTDLELAVYSAEFTRTGFQGGLQWYRCRDDKHTAELQLFSGRTIDVPVCFIAGAKDWGVYQAPGSLERMSAACTQFKGVHLIEGAGHWVQQEKPDEVSERVIQFLSDRN